MPRSTSKTTATTSGQTKKTGRGKSKSVKNENDDSDPNTVVKCNDIIDFVEQDDSKAPNLDQFKFEKRPHVKIEFEKASPAKEEPGIWEPPKWREFLLNLKNMRANNDAPVDTMGCHMSKDDNAPPEVIRYQHLISLMLSSQTKDQVTFAAMERLIARGLTIDNVLMMTDDELGQLIYPVGFWKTKVKYIKKTTQTLKELYKGDIPDSAEKLCKLTGVGPKMAHICMSVAWNKVTGIGVDTHVHRISNRIGWVKKPTSTPEDTRKALETWLPFDLWSEVNHLMVGFGQTICLPIGPNCHECLNNDICPSSGLGKKSPKEKSPMKKSPIKNDDVFAVKRELAFEKVEPEKSPRKRKVTPKKNEENVDENVNFQIKSETITIKVETNNKSPKVRKVTPNKDLGAIKNITIKVETNKKSPNRKVTPKKDIEEDNKSGNITIKVETNTKSPKIRKLTPNKAQNDSASSKDIVSQTKPVKKNASKQDKEGPPKKSPRTKKVENEQDIENDEAVNKKKTRSVKK